MMLPTNHKKTASIVLFLMLFSSGSIAMEFLQERWKGKMPALDGLRLMMVTTETQMDRVREALDSGADEYIMKPFDKEMLLEKLTLLGIDV